jgi:ferredoxin
VRPPGSVPEREFLRLCIRCGECLKACPFNVLQPMGFGHGLDFLWTPQAVFDWSGCDPTCANCGQVCPTGAVRALPLPEKAAARMGLAIVDERTCLPHAGCEACRLCADECTAAGYKAIEFVRVRVETEPDGTPIEGTGYLAPLVVAGKCNGCGLCHTRCHAINVLQRHLLRATAIRVVAGPGREDRLTRGSYRALREAERKKQQEERLKRQGEPGSYLPEFLK